MISLGLDIGTTTICGVAVDSKSGDVLNSFTLKNSFINTENKWERIQSPQNILETVYKLLDLITINYNISCIGITGQMHGIVYLDKEGNAVSPLYTWQDARGSLEYKSGITYAQYIGEKSGYGSATHFYNTVNGLVSENAVSFCTIHDYIAMKLSGNKIPYTDATNGASLGLFDINNCTFDKETIKSLGLDYYLFPKVTGNAKIIGKAKSRIPIITALGDNQASFIGSMRDMDNSVLVNVGTGSQISLFSPTLIKCNGSETRPCVNNGFLLVGASLCGGRAYAILEKFYNDILEMTTGERIFNMYDFMDKCAESVIDKISPPEIVTTFCGTRENPNKKGEILNISEDNFNPQSFALGMLNGIVTELFDMYNEIGKSISKRSVLVGSGNGIRKNKLLQKILAQKFNMKLLVPSHKEGAAFGAALNALVGIGEFKTINEAQSLIKYEGEV